MHLSNGQNNPNWSTIYFKVFIKNMDNEKLNFMIKNQNEDSSNDFIVYSKDAGEIAWLKSTSFSIIWDDGKFTKNFKKIYFLSDFGMSQNFWIYILIYCLSMLLILGFLHYFVVLKHFFPKAKDNDPLVRI